MATARTRKASVVTGSEEAQQQPSAPAPAASGRSGGAKPANEKPNIFVSDALRNFYFSKPEAEKDLDGGGWEWPHFQPYGTIDRLRRIIDADHPVTNNILFQMLVGNDGPVRECILCARRFQPKWSMMVDLRGLQTEETIIAIKEPDRQEKAARGLEAFYERKERVTMAGMRQVGLLKDISLSDDEVKWLDYFSTCGHPKMPEAPRLRGHYVLMGKDLEPRPHCGCFFFRGYTGWRLATRGCLAETIGEQQDEFNKFRIYFFGWPSLTVKIHRAIVKAQWERLTKNQAEIERHRQEAKNLFGGARDFTRGAYRRRGGLEVE